MRFFNNMFKEDINLIHICAGCTPILPPLFLCVCLPWWLVLGNCILKRPYQLVFGKRYSMKDGRSHCTVGGSVLPLT